MMATSRKRFVIVGFLFLSSLANAADLSLRTLQRSVSSENESLRITSKYHEDFASFVEKHQRSYKEGSDEYKQRLRIFSARLLKAELHNSKANRLWTAGVSPLADLTPEEIQEKIGWFGTATATRGRGSRSGMFLHQVSSLIDDLPEQVDKWNNLTSLAQVRNQGSCGSCWAVTSQTVLAAHAEIYGSSQRSFSTQELVNCVLNPRKCGGSGGCQGATVELAMQFAMTSFMESEGQDRYTASDSACHIKQDASTFAELMQSAQTEDLQSVGIRKALKMTSFGMIGWERLGENAYQPLLKATNERGPVAVSVDATQWDLYSSGIFDGCDADAVINHAVTLVGYGVDKQLKKKYYLIQNSWGPEFGENGRIRLLRRDDDERNCGIDHQPQEGTGCEGGPASVKVCGMCGILYDNVVPHFVTQK